MVKYLKLFDNLRIDIIAYFDGNMLIDCYQTQFHFNMANLI